MPSGTRSQERPGKRLIRSFWITVTLCGLGVHGQQGDGCGHTKLGTESGTLASPHYPGTYPLDVSCTWRLHVPQGRTLRLLFGDFDIERSVGCSNGSLVITPSNGTPRIGPLCGELTTLEMNVSSSDATVSFRAGRHRSGRGFLLSYTTDQFPELISCQTRGSHFSSNQLSVYCPAGCKDVPGDVWGDREHGYRDTSVLCKSAVHGGVLSDGLGGRVSVTRGRSLKLYDSTFANGVLSKMGSLSEHKLLFSHECDGNLAVSLVNGSSFWGKASGPSPRSVKPVGPSETWTADDRSPWVELELSGKSTVTGIITTGSVKSFMLLFSKDRKSWKAYRGSPSRERKVFEAHSDGHVRVMNSLFPPAVARFIQLKAVTWQTRASVQVQLLGCPVTRVTSRTSSASDAPVVKVNATTTRPTALPTGDMVLVKDSGSSQPVVVVVGVVSGLLLVVSCLVAGVRWRRRKKDAQMKKFSMAKGPVGCQSLQGKSLGGESELLSCPLETLNPLQRNVHDTLPSPPLNDYAEPGGQTLGSTFSSFSHYHAPGNLPEYAQPVPPEPEYATPFGEQLPEGRDPAGPPGQYGKRGTALPPPPPPPPACGGSSPGHTHYDCPSHRVLSNGYCTPSERGVYSEPRSSDSSLQDRHAYSEPRSSDSSLQDRHAYQELL